jgi:hypothetical protein
MSGHKLKYVRHAIAGFVVWPAKYPGLTHREVARAIRSGEDVKRGETLSAGFVEWDHDGRPLCMGRSESLDLDSREGDTEALRAEWGMTEPVTPPLNPAALADAVKFGAGIPETVKETAQ